MNILRRISGLLFPALLAGSAVGCGGVFDDPQTPANASAQNGNAELPEPAPVEPRSEEVTIGGTEEDPEEYEDTDPAAVTEFREPLAPYGNWVDHSTYGTVWVPNATVVGSDFVPYSTAGHWVYENDYTWVSDYSWGWAPFHYGRWVWIDGYGWSWIAGRRYAPAWVTWRVGPVGYGYVGWAPMAPYWYWHRGYAYHHPNGWLYTPRYVYCPTNEVFHGSVGSRTIRGGALYDQAHAGTREYKPAAPTVATGPKPAKPGVATNRFAPDPRRDLGLSTVPSAPIAGVDRARLFASPRTAVEAGAQPPVTRMNGSNAGIASRPEAITSRPDVGARATPSTVLSRSNDRAWAGTVRPGAPDSPTFSRGTSPTFQGSQPMQPPRAAAPAAPTSPSWSSSPSSSWSSRSSSAGVYAPGASAPAQSTPRSANPVFNSPAPRAAAPSFSAPRSSSPTISRPSVSTPSPSRGSVAPAGGGGSRAASAPAAAPRSSSSTRIRK